MLRVLRTSFVLRLMLLVLFFTSRCQTCSNSIISENVELEVSVTHSGGWNVSSWYLVY